MATSSALQTGEFSVNLLGNVTNFTATGQIGQIVLSWTNPGSLYLVSVEIYRKAGEYSEYRGDGSLIYAGLATTFTDTTALDGVTYYYTAFAKFVVTGNEIYSDIVDSARDYASTLIEAPRSGTVARGCCKYDFISSLLNSLTNIYNKDAKLEYDRTGVANNIYSLFSGFDKILCDAHYENLRVRIDNYLSKTVTDEAVTKGKANGCDCLLNVNVFQVFFFLMFLF